MAHVRDRLNRMYGDSDRVPLMDHRLTVIGHPDLVPPSSGEAPLRGAMLYFLPPELKKRVEGVWPTSAKADMNNDAIEKVWHTTAQADMRRGADFGRTDIPVGQTTSNLKPQTSNLAPGLFSTLAAAFLPSEARAWSGGAAELDRLHFFHTDHLGSTRIVTDCAGALYERIDYLPFGEIFRDDVSSGPDTNYDRHRNKYTGQTWDYLTGLYYYNARYYDPEMGRFSQADTMVPRPLDSQTFNRYSYVNNNPYKYVDPSGHLLVAVLWAVAILMATLAITSGLTGSTVPLTFESVGQAALQAAIFSIPGMQGVAFYVGCLSFAVNAIQAANGDKGALANCIVSLMNIGYSYYKRASSGTNGAGGDISAANGEELELTGAPDPAVLDGSANDRSGHATEFDIQIQKSLDRILMVATYVRDVRHDYATYQKLMGAYNDLQTAYASGQIVASPAMGRFLQSVQTARDLFSRIIGSSSGATDITISAWTDPLGVIHVPDMYSLTLDYELIHESSHWHDLRYGAMMSDPDDLNLPGATTPGSPDFSRAFYLSETYRQWRQITDGAITAGKFRWPR